MAVFELIPHGSIGPARLGAHQDEIRAAMGKPSAVEAAREQWGIQLPNKDYFFCNAFQVSYDADLRAEFIEVAASPDYSVLFCGLDVHCANSSMVLEAFSAFDTVDADDSEYPGNQVFREIDVSIYNTEHGTGQIEAVGIGVRGYTSR